MEESEAEPVDDEPLSEAEPLVLREESLELGALLVLDAAEPVESEPEEVEPVESVVIGVGLWPGLMKEGSVTMLGSVPLKLRGVGNTVGNPVGVKIEVVF